MWLVGAVAESMCLAWLCSVDSREFSTSRSISSLRLGADVWLSDADREYLHNEPGVCVVKQFKVLKT